MADCIFVVLHHQHRVAQIAQPHQRLDQPHVVALVQPDRRFIQHVQNTPQSRSDLRRQPDPLALSAGERGRVSIQRQVIQSHRAQKLQPFHDFAPNPLGNQ